MKKTIGLSINDKEYILGEYDIKDINDLYSILFNRRDILKKEKVEGISDYSKDDESFFITDIRNFINNKETEAYIKTKETGIEGLIFDLNINKKVNIYYY